MDRHGGIGITDEHRELAATVRRWVEARGGTDPARAALDGFDDSTSLPDFWPDVGDLGWPGLAVSEDNGGSGFGLAEVAIVLEQLGQACSPGPLLWSAATAHLLDRHWTTPPSHGAVADLASGARVGVVGFGCDPVDATAGTNGSLMVTGKWDVVPSAAVADLLVLPVVTDGIESWIVVDRQHLDVELRPSIDRTRPVATVRAADVAVDGNHQVVIPDGPSGVATVVAMLLAAESVGLAAWCVDTAAEHATTREQFGRPIGQFQAVKHRCADMLCVLEQARAATWDATRPADSGEDDDNVAMAASVAAALAVEAAYSCSKDCIQVLGGIGFTWEHDAHLYLKRAMANRLLAGGAARWRARVARAAIAGVRRDQRVDLPAEAESFRTDVGAFLDDLSTHEKSEWNRRVAEAGYLVPHWPEPWGRDASPLEQLVVDEAFRMARVRRPHLAVGAWALPTIIVHGTDDQRERFVMPTVRGEISWCQMFSEPGAGSDLASLTTRAARTDGGWLLTGQKVWTSLAHFADWGICLARTDPDAPKHAGIGCFLVDMTTEGLDVRPLRELTGAEMFNEVFLTEVFVPDECLVGGPTEGWSCARTTLGNERVSMGSGSSMGPGVEALLGLVDAEADLLVLDTIGSVVATTQSLAAMGSRLTLRALSGAEPGPEASIRKLLGVEHDQRVQEVALDLLGRRAAANDELTSLWVGGFLGNRSLSIAGGTSEIQRNVIAERLLGLPKD